MGCTQPWEQGAGADPAVRLELKPKAKGREAEHPRARAAPARPRQQGRARALRFRAGRGQAAPPPRCPGVWFPRLGLNAARGARLTRAPAAATAPRHGAAAAARPAPAPPGCCSCSCPLLFLLFDACGPCELAACLPLPRGAASWARPATPRGCCPVCARGEGEPCGAAAPAGGTARRAWRCGKSRKRRKGKAGAAGGPVVSGVCKVRAATPCAAATASPTPAAASCGAASLRAESRGEKAITHQQGHLLRARWAPALSLGSRLCPAERAGAPLPAQSRQDVCGLRPAAPLRLLPWASQETRVGELEVVGCREGGISTPPRLSLSLSRFLCFFFFGDFILRVQKVPRK